MGVPDAVDVKKYWEVMVCCSLRDSVLIAMR
jgi:hypothetical protein